MASFNYLLASRVEEPDKIYYYYDENSDIDVLMETAFMPAMIVYRSFLVDGKEKVESYYFLMRYISFFRENDMLKSFTFEKIDKEVLRQIEYADGKDNFEWNIYSRVDGEVISQSKGLIFSIVCSLWIYAKYISGESFSNFKKKHVEPCIDSFIVNAIMIFGEESPNKQITRIVEKVEELHNKSMETLFGDSDATSYKMEL